MIIDNSKVTDRETVCCDLCSSDMFEPLFHEVGYTIGRCKFCSMYYLRERPLSEGQSEIITDAYQDIVDVNGKDYFFENSLYRKMECSRYLDIIERYASKGRLLDVGCGIGTFLWFARKRDWNAEGIELNENRSRIARQMKIGKIHTLPVEECGLIAESYDAIVLIDVFSHLRSPKNTLSYLMRLLKPAGIIFLKTGEIVSMPKFDELPAYGFGVPHHLFWNSGATLKQYGDAINAHVLFKESKPYQEYMFRSKFLYRSKKWYINAVKAMFKHTPFVIDLLAKFRNWQNRHNPIFDSFVVYQKTL